MPWPRGSVAAGGLPSPALHLPPAVGGPLSPALRRRYLGACCPEAPNAIASLHKTWGVSSYRMLRCPRSAAAWAVPFVALGVLMVIK